MKLVAGYLPYGDLVMNLDTFRSSHSLEGVEQINASYALLRAESSRLPWHLNAFRVMKKTTPLAK